MEEGLAILLVLAFFAVVLLGVIFGWISFFQLQELKKEVATLRKQLTNPILGETELPTKVEWPQQPLTAAREKPPEQVSSTKPTTTPETKPVDSGYGNPRPVYSKSQPPTIAEKAPAKPNRWLESLKTNWMIWLGGASVGLSGIFLVKYSIDAGLLGPMARISLALVFGMGFHSLAVWLRLKTAQANDIFAALGGAASIIVYGALLAALHLYQLWPVGMVFGLLIIVSLATMALALLHGPVLAGIGILGAYLVPILVNTGSNNMLGALMYCGVITASALLLMRYVYRPWLWWGTLFGALAWWGLSLTTDVEAGVRLIYLTAVAYGILAIPTFDWLLKKNTQDTEPPLLIHLQINQLGGDQRLFFTLAAIIAAFAFSILAAPLALPVVLYLAPLPAGLLWLCRQQPRFNLAAWPTFIVLAIALLIKGLIANNGIYSNLMPTAEVHALSLSLVLLVALFTPGAFWNSLTSQYKGYWQSLACLAPIAALAIGYITITAMTTQWQWAAAALVLGAGYLHLAYRQQTQSLSPKLIAVLIICAHLAYSLSVVMVLREATLTLALALQVITLTWLHQKFQLPALVYATKALLAIVIARLTLNPWLLSYPVEIHWSLWVCGGSAAAVWLAARFAKEEAHLREWLQGAALHLTALTLLFETRYQLYDGEIFRHSYSYLEAAINTATWGLLGNVYIFRARVAQSLEKFYRLCGYLLLTAALANYALFLLLAKNPLWESAGISSTPLFNSLLLAYGAPVLLAALAYYLLDKHLRKFVGAVTGVCLLYFVSIEIHHLWQGDININNAISDGEHYTYSMVWLLLAVAGTIVGIRFQKQFLYKAAMLLLMLVVGKIFLFDMSGLTSLWRVASFMGLGLCLLGLAYIHQLIRKNSQGGNPAS